MVKNEKNTKITVGSLALIIGFLIYFIVSNSISNVTGTTPVQALFLSLALLAIAIICWLGVTVIVWIVRKHSFINRDEEDKRQLLVSAKIENYQPCKINNRACCLYALLKESGIKMNISEESIYDLDKINKIETDDKWKNIWIFSEDLSTEIDPKTGYIEQVVETNIARGVTYTEFCCVTETERTEIQNRENIMFKKLSQEQKGRLKIIKLQSDNNYIGKNTLPFLCGSILLSSYDNKDGTPYFEEGYLSMRDDKDGAPIYYKMPRCMRKEYICFFKLEKEKQENIEQERN
jgi:hypothetical protein